MTDQATVKPAKRSDWHYKPPVPIQVSPIFAWPPQPVNALKWLAKSWQPLTENAILVVFCLICWTWLSPSLATAKSFSVDWIAGIWLRNIVLMILVAGGLHLYFHVWKIQGKRLKFDGRNIGAKSRLFTFSSQTRDNVFWSLASGVSFWTAYEVIMFWAMANGYAPVLRWVDSPVWFILLFILTPFWISFHFYWIHRALHWPPLYKFAHALHHRNTNVGPWSGLSMHPFETAFFFSSIFIHFFIPAHPLHIIFHLQHQALTAATSHTGFEGLLVEDKNRMDLGRFHHQMHHRYFECNYGNLEMPWDKWFGTFHDGTDEAHERMKEHRRKMMGG